MGLKIYQYSYYSLIEYFVLVIQRQCDQSSLLDYKNNYGHKYTKIPN